MAVSGKERLQAMLDAAKGGPIVFHDPAEMMAITADDFPADASIVIHTTIGVLNPSVSGPWSVRNGRFLVNVIHGVRLEDWNVPVTPELFSRIERVAIEERARGANDIEYVASRIRPTPEMACAVQYTIKPEDSRLMVAYIHAYNVRKHIQEICYRAAALKYVDRVSKHVSNKSDIERRMFEHAEIFRNAADGLYRQACGTTITDDVRKILVDAEIMNRAFATELFIKCLLRIEDGRRPKAIHDVKQLFGKLKKAVRDQVVSYFYKQQSQSHHRIRIKAEHPKKRDEFGYALAVGKLAFVKYRYAYEMKKGEDGSGGGAILLAVRRAILDRRPDWTVLTATYSDKGEPHVAFTKP